MRVSKFLLRLLVLVWTIHPLFRAEAKVEKDCVSCNLAHVIGAPNISADADNIDKVIQVMNQGNDSRGSSSLTNEVKGFCMALKQFQGQAPSFKKEILIPMTKAGYKIESILKSPECTSESIGGTSSPILHLVADNVEARFKYLKIIYEYFLSRGEASTTWLNIINAPNSRQQSLLDYVYFLQQKKIISEDQGNRLIVFLCSTDGEFLSSPVACPKKK